MRISAITPLLAALVLSTLGPTAAHADTQPPKERDFYETVDDTLADFEYDLKHDEVKGVEDIAIRDILVNEKIPQSFTSQLESMLTERILRATKSRVLECIGCHARRMKATSDQISMFTPRTDPKEMQRLAKARGIQHFLDVTFSYQPNGILVSVAITQAADATIVWTHTYDSETSRAATKRRSQDTDGLDAGTRRITEYPASIQYRFRLDYLFEPNISGTTGCMGFAFGMVERYDNRKKEIGFELEYLKDSSTLMGSSSTAPNLYGGINLTMLMIHAFNLIGSREDYNLARGSVYGGLGGTYTSGYLGALARIGFEWRMARHFTAGLTIGYRPASTAFIPPSSGYVSVSGMEYGGGLSFLY